MADAILFLFLDQVKTIIDKAKKEVKLLVGVEEEVEKLERNLDLVLSVLADAEEKKTTDQLVKKWLDRLKEAAYDMEDALDEWKTRVELEVKGAEIAANRQGKVPLLCNFLSCFSFRRLSSRHEVAVNIKEINRRIDEIVKEKDKYQLESRKNIELPKRPESSSFVDVSKLCGRDGVKREILSYLLGGNSEVEAGKLIQTISIVGMGGLGKTTLAQLVCNHPDVKQHFESVVWVCVSDSFDEKRVAKAIIQGLENLSGSAAYGLESDPLEGFLGSNPNVDLESVGQEYFSILAAHSFFQDFDFCDGLIYQFKMHDVVHDFGKYLAEDEFAMELVGFDHWSTNSAKQRHLVVMVDKRMTFPTSISGAEKLRTVVTYTGEDALTPNALRSLFNHCRRLRLLDFRMPVGRNHLCNEVPEEIGKLMHLRYINLAGSEKLGRLPETLCNIFNLECLVLAGCQNLKHLPDSIGKLLNLRSLLTNGCSALTHYPKDIRKLTSLRIVGGIIARADRNDDKEFSLADLGNLKHLRRVGMKVVGNSIDKEEARKAELQNVEELLIYLVGGVEESDIIEALHPPSGIRFGFSDDYWFFPRISE
ncbi:hypothetical protein SLEP1_g35827 [Rubroshorea leprosula]|uniref:Uncharacterized protein n=1 Tax=Rubroshorea leprosula TaxID=152421 RepID=A0AAV5KPY6_9ROSI|nr:hypothetical protein SLEP1_g35827 [Rubroshorea leprosula]